MTTKSDHHSAIHIFILIAFVTFYFLTLIFSFVSPLLAFLIGVTLLTIAIIKANNFGNLKPSIFWLPIYISATQNLGLAIFIDALSETDIKIYLTFSFLVYVLFFFFLLLKKAPKISFDITIAALTITFAYCIFLYAAKGGEPIAALSSLRNITAMYIFFYIGSKLEYFKSGNRLNDLGKGASLLVFIIFAFGIFERFFFQDLWPLINIEDLWLKKGLNIQHHGLPGNFYASERLDGEYIRRFVSTYADPINLGTNIFFLFALSWYCKNYIAAFICVIIVALAVSKGAILSLMCFSVIYLRSKFGALTYFLLTPFFIAAGIGFIYWAYVNNSTSVIIHILGFANSISTLWEHPLGHGLGNVGVLASLFGSQADEDIVESGIGLIIGQLGVPGLVLFLAFFYTVTKARATPFDGSRDQVLYRSLLFAILLNMAFNEVALSPNSCAGYFLVLGIMSSSNRRNFPPSTADSAAISKSS